MASNKDVDVELVGGLDEIASEQQIKKDVKKLNNIFVYLKAKLDFSEIRKQLGKNKVSLSIDTESKNLQTQTRKALDDAQKVADKNKVKVTYSFEMDKNKLQNQLKNFAKDNSKLFTSKDMTLKYNQLVDSASIAKNSSELKGLRSQLSAFKTELVAVNKAGMTWTDKFKKSLNHFAQYFSGASFIYAVTSQLKNAWSEAKTLDDRLVDLQKVTSEIENRDSLYKYFDKALKKANELNVKVDSLIYAITEFKKLGWSLSDAELGGQYATMLSNVGDIDIDTAIASIKTSIASFDKIGGYGNDQMNNKLEAYTDLINNMSNKYSINAEGLAEAIRLSAGTLTEANTTIEQAATMFAVANKYFNHPEYLGNAAKVGSLRIRATTGDENAIKELSELGEEVEEVTSLTGKLRDELIKLTGVDIMVDNNTFKSYYDQLYEISQVIDELDDTTSAKVLEMLFGKNRAAAGMALLSGMQESGKAYADAINSAGSATAEYETWMQSADAATQRFSNSLTEMYQSIINGNTVRDIANIGASVLNFANNFGIVEGAVKGFLALKIGTALTNGTMAFLSATKQVEQYGKALQLVNNIPNSNLAERYTALRSIAQATESLTTTQLKQVLVSEKISYQDRIRVLQMQGMTKEMAIQKLAEMGLTQVTNAQTVANTAQTASVFTLKSAMLGLKATIQSTLLSNPIGIALMGISIGFSAITSAISKHNQKLEETKQKNVEVSEKVKELVNNYESITSEITSLEEKLSDLNNQIDGLDPITDEQDIKNLKLETAELNAQLAILREKQAIAKQEAEDAAVESLSMKQGSKYSIDDKTYIDHTTGKAYEGKVIREVTSYEELQLAIDAYKEYEEKVLSLQEELLKLEESDPEYSKKATEIQEWSDKMKDARSDASELYTAVESQAKALSDDNKLKVDIDPVIEAYQNLVSKINDTTDALEENKNAFIATFEIEPFNETMQAYEEGYSKLISAQEELNNAGALSADTFVGLQESGLLEYIEFTSDGLIVNTDMLLANAQATKDKAVSDLHAAMTSDMLKIALGNVDSISEEAKAVIEELGNNTEEAGNQALSSVANWATLGATITDTMARARGEDRGFNGVNEAQKAQMEAVYDYYYSMAEKVSAIDITVPDRTKQAKSSAKKETDAYLEEFEKALAKLKTLKEQGKISESEFLTEYKALYEKYFKDIDKYADEFAKHQYERFKGLEDLYNSAISAISKLKDEEIDALNDTKDNALDALEKERDARLDVIDTQKEQLEAQNDLIDKQIEAKEAIIEGIEDEIEAIEGVIDGYEDQIEIHNAKIDAINAEIDAMRDANDERKREIDLQKAQYDLERMKNQRVDLAYQGGQMIFRNDDEGLRDARENVADKQLEIKIANKEKEIKAIEKEISQIEELISHKEKEIEQKEKSISLIEDEIELFEKQKDAINEQIDALDKQSESTENYYDNLIKQQEDYYNSLLENMEKEKNKWTELAEIKEVTDAYSHIKQVFGQLGYSVEDVLNDSAGAFDAFKTQYVDLMNTLNPNASFGEGLGYAVGELDRSLSEVGTTTEGLDALPDKMDGIISSVAATTEAFNGEENSLGNAVQGVIDKVAGGSEEGSNAETSKEGQEETDTNSLIGAIQAQSDLTLEVIPKQIEMVDSYTESIRNCVTELNNMFAAMEKVASLSINGIGATPVTPYASGTTYAKKGLAVVGEEAPELIEDKKGNLSLASKPTLVNMEGGEKVYNGEKTKELLKPLDESSRAYQLQKKFDAYLEKNPIELFTYHGNIMGGKMKESIKSMQNVQNVNNNTNKTQNVTQNINVTLPNVTNETGFKNFEREMMGYQNYARQQCSITR